MHFQTKVKIYKGKFIQRLIVFFRLQAFGESGGDLSNIFWGGSIKQIILIIDTRVDLCLKFNFYHIKYYYPWGPRIFPKYNHRKGHREGCKIYPR